MAGLRVMPEPDEASSNDKKPSIRKHDTDGQSTDEETPSRKRARATARQGKAVARTSDDEGSDAGADDQLEDEEGPAAVNNLVRDTDGYVMGSITRIACRNFLTYDQVEFQPGPALNMVIGPNGTGKSTIACAIAIGLGFNPAIMGRSSKSSQYVKMGSPADEPSWVEIELKGRKGKKNLVIRRVLARDKDSSQFLMDGAHATNAAVMAKMEELNVQVNNLCTFLPQDRVAHFSGLSHSQLLVETQRAAGDRHLSSWHQSLIDTQEKQKQGADIVERLEDKLKRREAKQAEAEKEVRQFEQRAQLENEANVLDLLLKYAEYDDTHARWGAAREQKNQVESDLKEAEAANQPFKDSQAGLEQIIGDYNQLRNDVSKRKSTASSTGKDAYSKLERISTKSEDLQDQLKELTKNEQRRKETIVRLEREITALQKQVENKPEDSGTAKYNAIIREKQHLLAELGVKISEQQQIVRDIAGAQRSLIKDQAVLNNRMAEMKDARSQRLEATRRWEPDVLKALKWMQENKGRFKGKVYEPARLTVFATVKAQEQLNVIEGPMGLNAWKTFLYEEQEDYDLMMREVNDGGVARINGSMIDKHATRDTYKNALDEDGLKRLGFDCFACDKLQGPEPVLAWLTKTNRLNTIPLQLGRRDLNLRMLEQVPGLDMWYTLEGSYTKKTAIYGARYVQREQRALAKAKVLSAGVDTTKLAEIQRGLQELDNQTAQLKDKNDQAVAIENELQDQAEVLNGEIKQASDDREEAKKPMAAWSRARVRLDQKVKDLAREKKAPSTEVQRKKLQGQVSELSASRLQYALQYKKAAVESIKLTNDTVEIHLRLQQAESDLAAMTESSNERDQEIRDLKTALSTIKQQVRELKEIAKETFATIQEAENAVEEHVSAAATERRNEGNLERNAVAEQLAEIRAQLEMTSAISSEVLNAYKKRQQEIDDGREELKQAQGDLDGTSASMDRTKSLWKPRLDTLIESISVKFRAAFDALGLTGEIRLDEKEEYKDWGIQILVAFRDNAALHVLSPQRQSGGERALTTVMYLMSLAELAQAPFALVDEINQGMDQRVERQVHNALVKTTCKNDVGQYFLLTPKLLPDLNYHPLMKVLVIQSGCWLPTRRISLADVVSKKLKRVRKQQKQHTVAAH